MQEMSTSMHRKYKRSEPLERCTSENYLAIEASPPLFGAILAGGPDDGCEEIAFLFVARDRKFRDFLHGQNSLEVPRVVAGVFLGGLSDCAAVLRIAGRSDTLAAINALACRAIGRSSLVHRGRVTCFLLAFGGGCGGDGGGSSRIGFVVGPASRIVLLARLAERPGILAVRIIARLPNRHRLGRATFRAAVDGALCLLAIVNDRDQIPRFLLELFFFLRFLLHHHHHHHGRRGLRGIGTGLLLAVRSLDHLGARVFHNPTTRLLLSTLLNKASRRSSGLLVFLSLLALPRTDGNNEKVVTTPFVLLASRDARGVGSEIQ